ncbi:Lcl domain-containing protein [Shewanella donghaensis]|uniref:Lcl domain-containing protein n=1 Tax=Shewanella donghaensis TaxID=238836 RepID=UPI0013155491|nr:DUF1566 domain-containing protein [Shewanella donghaensis]
MTQFGKLIFKRSSAMLVLLMTASLITACGSSDESSEDPGDVINPSNNAPIASAGNDQTVDTGMVVTLNGSMSSDIDGDPLSYLWTIDSAPNTSVTLTNAQSVIASFTPDSDGEYVISLVVNDGSDNSQADTIIIHSSSSNTHKAYAIVDTNQSICYSSSTGAAIACSGSGYDADYSGVQPSYSLSNDGLVVIDNVTGLIWQQSSDINSDGLLNYDDKLFQSAAVAHCDNLTLADRDDWRLPNVKEAYSLILFSGKDASDYQGTDTSTLVPFIDGVFDWAFGDLNSANDRIIDGQYASTTLYKSTTMNGDPTMFGVNYVDGRIKGYPTDTKPYYVRCVAGNEDYGTNEFVAQADGTVSDIATELMWQQNDAESSHWDDAVSQCETATTGSFSDWRLPNIKELQSLIDYSVSPDTHNMAAIDPIFNSSSLINEKGEIDWGYYWSSTTHVANSGDGSNATYVSFGRALGYMQNTILDVHGAGSQRSNDKLDVASEPGASSAVGVDGIFYYKGPQGDILRANNKLRCVRDFESVTAEPKQYTLFSPLGSTDTFLINTLGETVHTWQSEYRPGLSVYLTEEGELLRTGSIDSKPDVFEGQFGGSAGVIEILDWDSNVVWSQSLATDTYMSHHDVEQLPNGNILAIVWEAKTAAEALALGRTRVTDDTLWADAIYEICRSNSTNTCTDGEIVWRWSIWDHIVQDVDSSITNTYVSDINEHSDKVNLNLTSGGASSDWTHINSVDYNAETQQILVSVHNFNEYWIINHDALNQGIVSRVGNPAAYNGTEEQMLFVQHDAQWIEAGLPGAGNILVFNNGSGRSDGDYSSVDEFCGVNTNCTEGEIVSSYSEGVTGEFYASRISGAQRLANGNTLVCEGTKGRLFEYNSSHEITWEFDYGSQIFRATRYEGDYSGLEKLNL